MAQSEGAQGLTHVVYPDPPSPEAAVVGGAGGGGMTAVATTNEGAAPAAPLAGGDGSASAAAPAVPVEYRVLQVQGGQARIHWRYMPDSYDEWVPAASVDTSKAAPEQRPPRGPWRVHARWLADSER